MTPEERKAKQRAYNVSPEGIARRKKYRQSEKGKETRRKYQKQEAAPNWGLDPGQKEEQE